MAVSPSIATLAAGFPHGFRIHSSVGEPGGGGGGQRVGEFKVGDDLRPGRASRVDITPSRAPGLDRASGSP